MMTSSHDATFARTGVSGAVDWLHLAAAPTFAVMALLTEGYGGGPLDALCSGSSASPLDGMTIMYALMSAFHMPPWLRLIATRRRGADVS